MNIKRVVIAAVALAAVATPLAAGVASASPPGHIYSVTGRGASLAAAENDANQQMQGALLFYDHCNPTTYSNAVQSGSNWTVTGSAFCFYG